MLKPHDRPPELTAQEQLVAGFNVEQQDGAIRQGDQLIDLTDSGSTIVDLTDQCDASVAELADDIEVLETQERETDAAERAALEEGWAFKLLVGDLRANGDALPTAHEQHLLEGHDLVGLDPATRPLRDARELLGLIDPTLPLARRVADEREIARLAYEGGYDSTTAGMVLQALMAEAMRRHPSAQAYDETQASQLREQERLRAEAALNMERRGYAEVAPKFAEQLTDDSRTTLFTYNHLPPHMEPDGFGEEQMTEIEGLRELESFLSFFLETTLNANGTYLFPDDAEQAESLLDNLTFIGEQEYQRGAEGLVSLWKAFLDQDPAHKICLVTGVSNSDKYPGKQKSDARLKARVLQAFGEEDLERYAGRFVDQLQDIQEDLPENVRVVLLDDWALSGRQQSRVYKDITQNPLYRKFADSIEANFLVASRGRVISGLEDPDDPRRKPIRVRSYYLSHNAPVATSANRGHITGLDSTANYAFGDTIEHLIKRLDGLKILCEIPPLASVVPALKQELVEA